MRPRPQPSDRMRLSAAVALLGFFLSAAATAGDLTPPTIVTFDDGWTMTIQPGPSYTAGAAVTARSGSPVLDDATVQSTGEQSAESPAPASALAPTADAPPILPAAAGIAGFTTAGSYQAIYESIPFSRSEYNVQPNYRHQATMDLLTGQRAVQSNTTTNINVETNAGGHYGWSPYTFGPYYRGSYWGYRAYHPIVW